MCREKFDGDLDNFKEVSDYLSKHLNEAKEIASRPKKVILSTTRDLDYLSYFDDDIDPYIEDALRNDMFP